MKLYPIPRRALLALSLVLSATTGHSEERATPPTASLPQVPQPKVVDGSWNIPLRYWCELSPLVEGTGGFDFLCEVQALGDRILAQDQGPARFQTGVLKVIEVLHADTERFPALKTVRTLHVEGCEGLQVGDRLLLFVDSEPYEGGYVIDRHRGTNCLIGHRLACKDEKDADGESEAALLELVRKGRTTVSKATPDELRVLARMDPAGVAEGLIRMMDMGDLVRKPAGK